MEPNASFCNIAHKAGGRGGSSSVTANLQVPAAVGEAMGEISNSLDEICKEAALSAEINREGLLHLGDELTAALRAIRLDPMINIAQPAVSVPETKVSVEFKVPSWFFPAVIAAPVATGIIVALVMKFV